LKIRGFLFGLSELAKLNVGEIYADAAAFGKTYRVNRRARKLRNGQEIRSNSNIMDSQRRTGLRLLSVTASRGKISRGPLSPGNSRNIFFSSACADW